MGFIEDQNRKLAEEKQLAGKGMEYLDTKRAMDIARAQEAQRALNMRPADGGLANRYAQEILYNPGMNEEAKYAEAVYKKMQGQAPKGFYDQSLVEDDVDRYTLRNLDMLKKDDKAYNDAVLNAIRENRDYNATRKALQDRQAKATSGYDGYGGGNESMLDFILFNNIDKAAVDKYNSNIDQGLAAKFREVDTYGR